MVGGDQLVAWHLINKLLVRSRDRRIDECYVLSVSLSAQRDPGAAINGLGAFPLLVRLLNQAVPIVLRCKRKPPDTGSSETDKLLLGWTTPLDQRLDHNEIKLGAIRWSWTRPKAASSFGFILINATE